VVANATLVGRVRADLERTAAWMDANPGNFDWSYLGSPRAVTRAFELAAELFATDYAPDGRRYVAAGLPELPFADHLVDTAGRPYPRLEEVRGALAAQGVDSQVRTARCAWQPGGDRLLACWRRAGLDRAAVTRR
jgi:hypothetical protein